MTRAQVAHQKKAFLGAFTLHGNVSAACRAAKVPRRTVYSWQEHDEAFSLAFKQAEIEATETLEGEAFRRAFEGVTSEKFTPYGVERKVEYSDTLLIFLLKARAPEKYRERHDITTGGQPLTAAHADLDSAIERRLAELAARGEGAGAVVAGSAADTKDAAG